MKLKEKVFIIIVMIVLFMLFLKQTVLCANLNQGIIIEYGYEIKTVLPVFLVITICVCVILLISIILLIKSVIKGKSKNKVIYIITSIICLIALFCIPITEKDKVGYVPTAKPGYYNLLGIRIIPK